MAFKVLGSAVIDENENIVSAGGANFAGNVELGATPTSGAAEGVLIRKNGRIELATNQSSTPIFEGYTVGVSSPTSNIKADGSSEFFKTLLKTPTGTANSTNLLTVSDSSSNVNFTVKGTGATDIFGPLVVDRNAGGDPDIGSIVVQSGGAVKTRLNDDGSATFAANVDARNINASRPTTNLDVFSGYGAGTLTSQINANGSATFTGTVDAGALTIGGSSVDTSAQVDAKIAALVDGAPTALNTLNELAAALNDQSDYAASITSILATKANSSSLATVATSGSYTDLSNKPTIPTTTSQLTNNSGFITSADGGNADKLDGQEGSYYLDYSNLSNVPSVFSAATTLDPGTNYQTYQATTAANWTRGVSIDFVHSDQGWPSYGTVLTAKAYSGGGGTFQFYNGYASNYGGNYLRYRTADYSSNTNDPQWTSWMTVWTSGNDGSGSGLDADLLDGLDSSAFVKQYEGATLDVLGFSGVGGDSGNGNHSYAIYQAGGAWSNPYPDLVISYHTGIRIGANYNYGGTRFYSDSPDSSGVTELFSVGNGNFDVAVTNTLNVGGHVSASGNVTAYASDRRLKENFKHIESPLEKIQKLNGYTFDWIDGVKELGFEPSSQKDDIGLIAQEVQEVMPQATAPAPFDQEWDTDVEKYVSKSGEDYLTIQYEKLVPLLVEAIKDQQKQIDELNKKLGGN